LLQMRSLGQTLVTGEFLDLEREIDNFASQVGTHALSAVPIPVRKGRTAGLGDQLAKIERNAKALREKAVERRAERRQVDLMVRIRQPNDCAAAIPMRAALRASIF
jgi:hypothetical protein